MWGLLKKAENWGVRYEIKVPSSKGFVGQEKYLKLLDSMIVTSKYLSVKHTYQIHESNKWNRARGYNSCDFDNKLFLCTTIEMDLISVEFCQMHMAVLWGWNCKEVYCLWSQSVAVGCAIRRPH